MSGPPSRSPRRRDGLQRWLFGKLFQEVHVEPGVRERVEKLAERGGVIYVLRDRSRADEELARAVLERESLPPPEVVVDAPPAIRTGPRTLGRHPARDTEIDAAVEVLRRRGAVLIFLRCRPGIWNTLFRPEQTRRAEQLGRESLTEIFDGLGAEAESISLVPLAPVRGRGYRRRDPDDSEAFVYSVQDSPGELAKLATYVTARLDLSLKVGAGVSLADLGETSDSKPETLGEKAADALREYLQREERVVWGPGLIPKWQLRDQVLRSAEIEGVVADVARERGASVEKVWREARGIFDEIAANFKGLYFGILKAAFFPIWRRMFRGYEIDGLDKVAERIRDHSVILVPCHRSHFDYLILTYLFHKNFLSVPHIAAGINLSFFPMGMLFRGAGAFFIRRSFGDDPLYKTIFRQYLGHLMREGYTLEFFIEGGRSRTGKILTPKLGMLGAVVESFARDLPRDVSLVPVSIHYERLVEEQAYKAELLGEEKKRESFAALWKARSVLQRNYGKVHIRFAEPISLADAMGDLREEVRTRPHDEEVAAARRRFTLKMGFRLLREVNRATALSAPTVAATVLLSPRSGAIRKDEFLARALALVEHAEWSGARFNPSLERDRGEFQQTLIFLERSRLLKRFSMHRERGVLSVPVENRINLDFLKNNGIHLFVILSLVADAALREAPGESSDTALEEEVWWWLGIYRNEFVLPERGDPAGDLGKTIDRVRALQAEAAGKGDLLPAPLIRAAAPILRNFHEAYWVAARVLGRLSAAGASEADLAREMRRTQRAHAALGELYRPESGTTVTQHNAIVRFEELGYVVQERRGPKGRERWVLPGPKHAELKAVDDRIAGALRTVALEKEDRPIF